MGVRILIIILGLKRELVQIEDSESGKKKRETRERRKE